MSTTDLRRRSFLQFWTAFGLSSTLFPGALWARLQEEEGQSEEPLKITLEMLQSAEQITGLEFTPSERELMLEGVNEALEKYQQLRTVTIDNSIPPALHFNPLLPGMRLPSGREPFRLGKSEKVIHSGNLEELAFLPVTHLSRLFRSKQVSSVELTRMYLDRLKRFDPQLHCVVTLTEELAMRQAERADRELAAGHYRGPLHGIPWGAKDLLAVKGYPTTWGAKPYQDQVIEEDATVVRRLEEAGAVLVAKLTLGALAWGDEWFGEKTRNPWNLEQGSSGSSAGSASATAAGLVGFSIGSETWGSIVSPCTRCGVTGLRPTFGRVSRHGAMALSWSMDKLGPICRSVEDCALVLDAIYGPDGKDLTVRDAAFSWDGFRDPREVRVGYIRSLFEAQPESEEGEQTREADRKALETLRESGFELVEVELPDSLPLGALSIILSAEAAAAFDDLTRSNRDAMLKRQIKRAWPNEFRMSRFIPAVEYIQANRVRTMIMGAMEAALQDVDVYVAPSFGGQNLLLTNLTGHPCVVVPNGIVAENRPISITFTGKLFREAQVLHVAKAYQDATSFHKKYPPAFVT